MAHEGRLPEASHVLEPEEEKVCARLWKHLLAGGPDKATEGTEHLSSALFRLEKLWDALEVHPSILRGQTLGARHRDVESLLQTLSLSCSYTIEVFLPTRAAVCRAFLQAKLNFCRLMGVVATELLADDPAYEELTAAIEKVRTSAVCTIMAEDLLRKISLDDSVEREVKRRATRVLIQMWEDRACQVVPRFFPVLDSVWQAKSHVTISFGTLTGASELLDLMGRGGSPVLMDCFSRDLVSDEDEYALQEFVFNVSFEQIQQIQSHMNDHGPMTVDVSMVAHILRVPEENLLVRTCTCEDMIFTFRERQSMANHRNAFDLPGPKRTAEQYLMMYLLELASDDDIKSCEVRA